MALVVLVGLAGAGAGRGVVCVCVAGGAGLLAGPVPVGVVLTWVAAGAGALGVEVAAGDWLGALALRLLGWVGLGGLLAASPQPVSIAAAARTLSAAVGSCPLAWRTLARLIGKGGLIGAGGRPECSWPRSS